MQGFAARHRTARTFDPEQQASRRGIVGGTIKCRDRFGGVVCNDPMNTQLRDVGYAEHRRMPGEMAGDRTEQGQHEEDNGCCPPVNELTGPSDALDNHISVRFHHSPFRNTVP
ncbi:hypothetical protein Tasa_038_088 [Tanticharoenia sakaeratensis NBRC 103193]|uniref:Uncharacterized protein n=1 Tax=Tanticharoenia sakaeratensis NBRC 103193 TaxID=1231623 RepID=A0A0D6MN38_9PROT|nr:hypothetical protein Tasa_038_088 [Tanticharoenia sakaeratensis NBRC 103193]